MQMNFETLDESLIIHLKGELDHHNSISARDRIELKLTTTDTKNIVYDLTDITFMDSSGISLIANGYKIAKNFSRKIFILTTNEKYKKIFTMAKLEDIATIISEIGGINQWKTISQ